MAEKAVYPTELDPRPGQRTGIWRALRDILYGLFFHDHVIEVYRRRAYVEALYLLVTLGDILGFPILSPYYSLQVLPHVLPKLEQWKRFVFREKDITDFA